MRSMVLIVTGAFAFAIFGAGCSNSQSASITSINKRTDKPSASNVKLAPSFPPPQK